MRDAVARPGQGEHPLAADQEERQLVDQEQDHAAEDQWREAESLRQAPREHARDDRGQRVDGEKHADPGNPQFRCIGAKKRARHPQPDPHRRAHQKHRAGVVTLEQPDHRRMASGSRSGLTPRGGPNKQPSGPGEQAGRQKHPVDLPSGQRLAAAEGIAQLGPEDVADKPARSQHSDHLGHPHHRRPPGDEGRRSAERSGQRAAEEDPQAVDGKPVATADRQVAEATSDKQEERGEPYPPDAVAIDGHAQKEPGHEASQHADPDNPAQMQFAAAEQRDEIGVAKQQRHGGHHQRVAQVRQPERRPVRRGLGAAGMDFALGIRLPLGKRFGFRSSGADHRACTRAGPFRENPRKPLGETAERMILSRGGSAVTS